MKVRSTSVAVPVAATLFFCASAAARAAEPGSDPASELDEILVTATLRDTRLDQLAASATVLTAEQLETGGASHFGDVLGSIPNLNWAGGTARPRYFQLRGIGELEQYQGAPNPSVGFLIDDIDFSGVAMPATLFDVERVEVLRGPQGTAYGANALAGLVNLVSRAPVRGFQARAEGEVGTYGARSGGLMLNDSLGDTGAWRVAAHAFRGDGFRDNAFLGRDDTNGFDEAFVRGRVRLEPSERLEVNLTALYSDIDDGYDAWSIDNSRVTQSDKPGRDAQKTKAASARIDYETANGIAVRSISSFADSDIGYSFDGDWGNDAFWGVNAPYDYFQEIARRRRTWSQLVKLGTSPTDAIGWTVGAYALRLTETNSLTDYANGEVFDPALSDYAATNLALFAQLDRDLGRWSLSAGLRGEQRKATYDDNSPLHYEPRDRMLGGHVSATLHLDALRDVYFSINRGYKAGGFNMGSDVPVDRRLYDPEYLLNFETGVALRSADGRADLRASVFYMRRTEQQVNTSYQSDPNDPLTFVQLTDNAARGENYGAELQAGWRPVEALRLSATLGLLEARFIDYQVDGEDLAGKAQPHAPGYQYGVNAEWRFARGFYARGEVNGVDAFAFSASAGNDQRSTAYRLVNLTLGYRGERWSASVWGRNVFDETYYPRGFYFGNEPPDFADKRYLLNGDPRRFGLTVAVDF
ncbi:MAG: TonB-dependent receptor plug domain-containing protein [Steroidobacteraceae bacterium]